MRSAVVAVAVIAVLAVLMRTSVAVDMLYIDDDAAAMVFGAASDTRLYRSGANALKTDGSLQAVGAVSAAAVTATGAVSATSLAVSAASAATVSTGSLTSGVTSAGRLSATNIAATNVTADSLIAASDVSMPAYTIRTYGGAATLPVSGATPVVFDTVVVSRGITSTSGNTRFVASAGGVYHVCATWQWTTVPANNSDVGGFLTTSYDEDVVWVTQGTTVGIHQETCGDVYLPQGGYVSACAYCPGSSCMTVAPDRRRFTMTLVTAAVPCAVACAPDPELEQPQLSVPFPGVDSESNDLTAALN